MPKLTAQQELISVAQAQGWTVTPVAKGRITFNHRHLIATAEFDSHQRIRAAVLRQPSPPRENLGDTPAEDRVTYLSDNRRERLLAFIRGEKFSG